MNKEIKIYSDDEASIGLNDKGEWGFISSWARVDIVGWKVEKFRINTNGNFELEISNNGSFAIIKRESGEVTIKFDNTKI